MKFISIFSEFRSGPIWSVLDRFGKFRNQHLFILGFYPISQQNLAQMTIFAGLKQLFWEIAKRVCLVKAPVNEYYLLSSWYPFIQLVLLRHLFGQMVYCHAKVSGWGITRFSFPKNLLKALLDFCSMLAMWVQKVEDGHESGKDWAWVW